jgi:hypothetical protein
MAEWLKAHAWKACVRETVPWVRIPLSPPPIFSSEKILQNQAFLEPPENDGVAPRCSTWRTRLPSSNRWPHTNPREEGLRPGSFGDCLPLRKAGSTMKQLDDRAGQTLMSSSRRCAGCCCPKAAIANSSDTSPRSALAGTITIGSLAEVADAAIAEETKKSAEEVQLPSVFWRRQLYLRVDHRGPPAFPLPRKPTTRTSPPCSRQHLRRSRHRREGPLPRRPDGQRAYNRAASPIWRRGFSIAGLGRRSISAGGGRRRGAISARMSQVRSLNH